VADEYVCLVLAPYWHPQDRANGEEDARAYVEEVLKELVAGANLKRLRCVAVLPHGVA